MIFQVDWKIFSLSLDYRNDYKNLKNLEKKISKRFDNNAYVSYNKMIKIIKDYKLVNSFRLLKDE